MILVTGGTGGIGSELLDEDQRARLLAIANRCPVHLTLSARIDIRTTLQ